MAKALLFDFDGTLADTASIIISTFHHSFKLKGIADRTDAEIKATIGLPLFNSYKKLHPELSDEDCNHLVKLYRANYLEVALKNLKAYPHVEEVLKKAKEDGYKMAVVSSKLTSLIELMVHALHFDSYFLAYIGEDQPVRKKPAPDMALLAMKKLGVKPEESIVIGDSPYDIRMGNSAGCQTVWASYGYGSFDSVMKEKPTYRIKNIEELIDVLHL